MRKSFDINEKDVYTFPKIADLVKERQGCLLIQFPPSATPLLNHKSAFIYFRRHGPTGNLPG
jgi:uncharacterized protein YecE (DUF72 family)